MKLEALYKHINETLGVNPDDCRSRSDNFAYLWSRAMFCYYARDTLGIDTLTIAIFIERAETVVRWDIRRLRALRKESDFVSRFVITRYDELRNELLDTSKTNCPNCNSTNIMRWVNHDSAMCHDCDHRWDY